MTTDSKGSEMGLLPGGWRDRRSALLVVGILQVVLGAGAWLMALLSALGASMARRQGMSASSMVPGLLMYGIGGALFVAMGIGVIRLRRWARTLWEVLSGGWLMFGVAGILGMAVWLPGMMRAIVPVEGAGGPPVMVMRVVMGVMVVVMLVMMVGIPLAFLLFFRSPHVKATCEAADPGEGWTDRCPGPVLGASVWMGAMGAMLLVMPFAYGGLFPWCGVLVRGVAAWGLWWGGAVLAGVAAAGLYQRRMWAWVLALGLVVLLGVSAVLTFLRADLRELYEAMGLVGPQLEMMQKMGLMGAEYTITTSLGGVIPFIGILLWALPGMRGAPAGRSDSAPGG